jgi:hypothetical protein
MSEEFIYFDLCGRCGRRFLADDAEELPPCTDEGELLCPDCVDEITNQEE